LDFFSKQLRSCDVRKVEGLTNPLTKEDIIMTSINAGGAFYRVQNELAINSERVSQSMQRLASGTQNIAPGDRTASTAVAFSMKAEVASLKTGMMNGTEALQAIEMVTNDLSSLNDIVVRLEELHALGTNGFNTTEDTAALNREATDLLAEMTSITSGATWKGNSIIGASANANLVQFGRNTTAIDIKLDAFAIPEVALGFHTTGDSILTAVDADGAGTGTTAYATTAGPAAAITAVGGVGALAVGDEVFYANLTASEKSSRGAAVALAGSDIAAGSAEAALSLLDLKTLVDNLRIDAGDLYNKVSNTLSHMSALNTGYQLDVQSKMDVDFAGETTELAKGQILAQAGTAMLAQANAQGQGMLALIQS